MAEAVIMIENQSPLLRGERQNLLADCRARLEVCLAIVMPLRKKSIATFFVSFPCMFVPSLSW
jgi:hypothetical protein|eukprot:COSAG06_NODE_4335_length_4357_cov_120.961954_4_plen_63_part_00